MSLFKKFQELILPTPASQQAANSISSEEIPREFVDFSDTYRVGILCYFTDYDSQEEIINYKKRLEQFGYECDVLLFIDKKEKENNIYLQYFDWNDLDKKTQLPHSPRTDRFIVKKYDLLLNLYFQPCKQLMYISQMSQARCRVGPYDDKIHIVSDILMPHDKHSSIASLIIKINSTLKLKPYERKHI